MPMNKGYSLVRPENGENDETTRTTRTTVNAAMVVEKMNGKGNFGTIEKGKRADLILIKENPLDDVANIKKILGVMASGRWYDKKMLKKMVDL